MNYKNCGKCKTDKEKNDFRLCKGKTSTQSQYLCSMCKDCERKMSLERYHNNREKNILKNREYKLKNKEKIKIHRRFYNEKNKEYIKARYKLYCMANKDKLSEIAIKYRRENPGSRILNALRNRLLECLRKNKSTEKYLGTSIIVVKHWLEWNWKSDMNWSNYGELWQIDHTLPIKSFNMDDNEDIMICFNWKNLMPMYKINNIKKHNKIIPFRVFYQESRLLKFKLLKYTEEDIGGYLQAYLYNFNRFLRNATRSNCGNTL